MLFLRLLNEAVDSLNIEYSYKFGRPHAPLDDMIKCCVIKVWNCFSSRRTMAELQLAYALGYIHQIYHFNTINNYMVDPQLAPYLERLYRMFALPLVGVESVFAVDSTGFSLPHKEKWAKVRLDKEYTIRKAYKKLHVITGVHTNIITSARITEGIRNDSPEFEFLVKDTARRFRIREVCADAGYLSRKNCGIAEEVGAVPYIMPKKGVNPRSMNYPAWKRMIRLWNENKQSFKEHYHRRSTVESTFSALKRKFSGYIRSKCDTSQRNELLCKVVCHNAAVLVTSIFCLGAEAEFKEC
jgi:transposase